MFNLYCLVQTTLSGKHVSYTLDTGLMSIGVSTTNVVGVFPSLFWLCKEGLTLQLLIAVLYPLGLVNILKQSSMRKKL